MRTLAVLRKTGLENIREWKILVLALAFGPFFVLLMWAYFSGAPTAYRLLVLSEEPEPTGAAADVIAAWREATQADGSPVFIVDRVTDRTEAEQQIRRRDADLLVVIPEGFSAHVQRFRHDQQPPAPVIENVADPGHARGMMAMALSDYTAFGCVARLVGTPEPLSITTTEARSGGRTQREFDLYVPALLVLPLIMVLFTAAATLIREVDRQTMTRLLLSRLSLPELLVAVTANQVFIGLAGFVLSFVTAYAVGYRTDGSIGATAVVGFVAILGVVAISLIVAAALSTVFELLTIGSFPFFVLMFFSEAMMPLPKLEVATVAGHIVYANDVLPVSPAVRALNQILNQGASLRDVHVEISVMLLVTAVYAVAGGWWFSKRHYRIR